MAGFHERDMVRVPVHASGGIMVSYSGGLQGQPRSQVGKCRVTFNSGISQPSEVVATMHRGSTALSRLMRLIDGNGAQISRRSTGEADVVSGKDCQFHFTVTRSTE